MANARPRCSAADRPAPRRRHPRQLRPACSSRCGQAFLRVLVYRTACGFSRDASARGCRATVSRLAIYSGVGSAAVSRAGARPVFRVIATYRRWWDAPAIRGGRVASNLTRLATRLDSRWDTARWDTNVARLLRQLVAPAAVVAASAVLASKCKRTAAIHRTGTTAPRLPSPGNFHTVERGL
jgi:hypothetical protein